MTESGDFLVIRSSRRAFVLGPVAALACGRRRATGFPGYAFVANAGEQSVAAVDLTSFTVARQIRLEEAPGQVVAHAERQCAYVLAPQTGTIYEIDAVELRVKRKLSLRATGVAMRLAPGGEFLWVLCRSPHGLVRLSLDKFQAGARLILPNDPVAFDLTYDGLAAVVAFPEVRTVGLLDLDKRGGTRVAPAGEDPRAVHFRRDGQQVLVANRSARMLTVVDFKTGTALVQLPLAVEPETFCVKADGGEVFVFREGHGCDRDRGPVSLPSYRDNSGRQSTGGDGDFGAAGGVSVCGKPRIGRRDGTRDSVEKSGWRGYGRARAMLHYVYAG